MLQGLSGSLFYWDETGLFFRIKSGIYVTHLSQTSLYHILEQFLYAGTCLKLVDIVVNKIENAKSLAPPTLRAFASSVSTWLRVCDGDICLLYHFLLVFARLMLSTCVDYIKSSLVAENTEYCFARRGESK